MQVLSTIATLRRVPLAQIMSAIVLPMIARLREREENVRVEVRRSLAALCAHVLRPPQNIGTCCTVLRIHNADCDRTVCHHQLSAPRARRRVRKDNACALPVAVIFCNALRLLCGSRQSRLMCATVLCALVVRHAARM
ncbi:hypothetical protein EON66_09155 [archaeon]|nr:MAG: hypothetical protein EON66_09155 [archaeon]